MLPVADERTVETKYFQYFRKQVSIMTENEEQKQ